ncbi:MAG: DUF192 domain-containing protein [Acidimicrobiales bacterium]
MNPPVPDHPVTSSSRMWVLWAVIGSVLGAALVAFLLRGADQPKDPFLLPPGDTTPPADTTPSPSSRSKLAGFDETTISVTLPSGQVLDWCVLLATSEAQHEQGLMNVTDSTLGGYDGMLFAFSADVSVSFYMKDTPMPLSIAFIGADGSVVGRRDMAPCLGQATCPLYGPDGPYRTALEVPQGGLTRLGIDDDATVVDQHRPCSTTSQVFL